MSRISHSKSTSKDTGTRRVDNIVNASMTPPPSLPLQQQQGKKEFSTRKGSMINATHVRRFCLQTLRYDAPLTPPLTKIKE